MATVKRRYSKEEFAGRGDALVASKVRPNLTPADQDTFVSIGIETGEYELDRNEMKAADRRPRLLSWSFPHCSAIKRKHVSESLHPEHCG